jgi:hypothetical protein
VPHEDRSPAIGLQPPRSARLACALQHILRDDGGHDRERIVPASDTTPPARGAPASCLPRHPMSRCNWAAAARVAPYDRWPLHRVR